MPPGTGGRKALIALLFDEGGAHDTTDRYDHRRIRHHSDRLLVFSHALHNIKSHLPAIEVLDDANELDLATSDFTIRLVGMLPDERARGFRVGTDEAGAGAGWSVSMLSACESGENLVTFRAEGVNGGVELRAANVFRPMTWNLVVVQKQGDAVHLYINGRRYQTKAWSAPGNRERLVAGGAAQQDSCAQALGRQGGYYDGGYLRELAIFDSVQFAIEGIDQGSQDEPRVMVSQVGGPPSLWIGYPHPPIERFWRDKRLNGREARFSIRFERSQSLKGSEYSPRGFQKVLDECYEDALKRNPMLVGDIRVDLRLAHTGEIRDAQIAQAALRDHVTKADLRDDAFEACLTQKVTTPRFRLRVEGTNDQRAHLSARLRLGAGAIDKVAPQPAPPSPVREVGQYGHATDYSWVQGKLRWSDIETGFWSIHYEPPGKATDEHRGHFCLDRAPLLDRYKSGDWVKLLGRISQNQGSFYMAGTIYEVTGVSTIAKAEAPQLNARDEALTKEAQRLEFVGDQFFAGFGPAKLLKVRPPCQRMAKVKVLRYEQEQARGRYHEPLLLDSYSEATKIARQRLTQGSRGKIVATSRDRYYCSFVRRNGDLCQPHLILRPGFIERATPWLPNLMNFAKRVDIAFGPAVRSSEASFTAGADLLALIMISKNLRRTLLVERHVKVDGDEYRWAGTLAERLKSRPGNRDFQFKRLRIVMRQPGGQVGVRLDSRYESGP